MCMCVAIDLIIITFVVNTKISPTHDVRHTNYEGNR